MSPGVGVTVSAARWLVAVIAAVTLAFLVETLVTQSLDDAIGSRANALIANVMPSVQLLTQVLGELDRLDIDLDEYDAAATVAGRARLESDREQITALVDAYARLPFFSYEAFLFAPLLPQLRTLAGDIDRLNAPVTAASLVALHRELDVVEQSVRQLVELDAMRGQQIGREIQAIRDRTTWMVALLDTVCVALAMLAAVLAVRLLRRAVRGLEAARQAGEQREAELASLADSLGQFAGRVAHDILSPLSSALLGLEAVSAAYPDNASVQRASSLGIKSVQRVKTLVDGLLEFSRAGGRPEPGIATPLRPLVAEILDELRPQATQERIALESADIPEGRIACSPGVLASLLSNLVRNAIRYMGTGETRRIDVRVLEAGERWRFEVQDTGPGIPVDQQHRIFEPHVQLAHGTQGIGLGLATVDRLVRAHAGALGVISTPGSGALFWFELPRGETGPPRESAPGGDAVAIP